MFSLTRFYKDRGKCLVKGSVQNKKRKSEYWRTRQGNFNYISWGNSSDYRETRTAFLQHLNINYSFNIERMNVSYTFDRPLIDFRSTYASTLLFFYLRSHITTHILIKYFALKHSWPNKRKAITRCIEKLQKAEWVLRHLRNSQTIL